MPCVLKRNRNEWYEPVKDVRNHYIQHCEEIYKTHATQRSRIAAADRFMRIVIVNKRTAWEDILAKTISEYAAGLAEYAKATVEVHLRGLRFFLRFLYEEGIVQQDHTASVPKMCCSTGERMHSSFINRQITSEKGGEPNTDDV